MGKIVVPTKSITLVPVASFLGIPRFLITLNVYHFLFSKQGIVRKRYQQVRWCAAPIFCFLLTVFYGTGFRSDFQNPFCWLHFSFSIEQEISSKLKFKSVSTPVPYNRYIKICSTEQSLKQIWYTCSDGRNKHVNKSHHLCSFIQKSQCKIWC